MIVTWLVLVCVALGANMNGEYLFANPDPTSSTKYSTEYTDEYFDVYSPPIQSRYGEVFWTMMDPVPLPDDIIKRFENKTIVIRGYEADQVQRTPNEEDVPWPIYYAYNHHYVAWVIGSNSKLIMDPDYDSSDLSYGHGFENQYRVVDIDDDLASQVPSSQFISEGNGGEYRKSYHGYPKGYGQFVWSPKEFHIGPMQIDTHNRDYKGPGFKPGPLPRNAAAPPNATYSGLLECPCTTRTKKVFGPTYFTQSKDTCPTPVSNSTECFEAAQSILPKGTKLSSKTVNNPKIPAGCSILLNSDKESTVYFNTAKSTMSCGQGATKFSGSAFSLTNVTVDLDASSKSVMITISGDASAWFGAGFGSSDMSGTYAIVINSTNVWEQKLGPYAAGNTLKPSITVVSNTVTDGIRTVVVTRPAQAPTAADYYTFDSSKPTISTIDAVGASQTFAHHKSAKGLSLNLVGTDAHTCVCYGGIQGSIDGQKFSKSCAPEPYGSLLNQKNPTCFVDTYQGGLHCCKHLTVLLDADQKQPLEVDEYHLKFRFYYQEFTDQKNLERLWHQTEQSAGEYDIPKCDDHTPPDECVYEINARFTVKQWFNGRAPPTQDYKGVKMIYCSGHCHAPSCISMELYNEDTGKLLCKQTPVVGTGTEIYNEKGYIAIPPCLFSEKEAGLIEPDLLTWDTNLLAIKKNNNTNAHYGDMAMWQCRGVLVP